MITSALLEAKCPAITPSTLTSQFQTKNPTHYCMRFSVRWVCMQRYFKSKSFLLAAKLPASSRKKYTPLATLVAFHSTDR
jgi:hypothetical protein